MLTLLAEPKVLLLDEPTNDVDTDMLTVRTPLRPSPYRVPRDALHEKSWPRSTAAWHCLANRIAAKHTDLAEHDQSDYVGLTRLTREMRALKDEVAVLESCWLELSERIECGWIV
jgi:hypothetical protein